MLRSHSHGSSVTLRSARGAAGRASIARRERGGYATAHLSTRFGAGAAGVGTFPDGLSPAVAPASKGLSLSRSR